MRQGLGVWVVAGLTAWSGAAQALTVEQLSKHAQGRVVHLSVRDDKGDEDGSGSGFVISREGRVATNYHVIENAMNVVAVFPDKREVKVTGVWAFDKDIDLAVLQLEGATYEPLVLAQEPAHEAAQRRDRRAHGSHESVHFWRGARPGGGAVGGGL